MHRESHPISIIDIEGAKARDKAFTRIVSHSKECASGLYKLSENDYASLVRKCEESWQKWIDTVEQRTRLAIFILSVLVNFYFSNLIF